MYHFTFLSAQPECRFRGQAGVDGPTGEPMEFPEKWQIDEARTDPGRGLFALSVFAACALLLPGSMSAGADRGESRGPVIRFERMTHDFGEIPSNRKVAFEWEYHNDGDAPLQITGTRPQCGCTATLLDHRMIPPGGSGILKITFDPAGMNGSVRKSLAVTTNAAGKNRLLLTLKASVIPVETAVEEGAHPPIAGQSFLLGKCAECHAAPARGRAGRELFTAICAFCHGENGGGGSAPSIREKDYLASHSNDELTTMITYGSANPKMPGFSELMGGPLSKEQIVSLVDLLRSWETGQARKVP